MRFKLPCSEQIFQALLFSLVQIQQARSIRESRNDPLSGKMRKFLAARPTLSSCYCNSLTGIPNVPATLRAQPLSELAPDPVPPLGIFRIMLESCLGKLLEPLAQLVVRQWLRIVKSLHGVAFHLFQNREFLRRLHTFGHHCQAATMR